MNPRCERGIHGAVKDERAHAGRKELGIEGAEERAVRESNIQMVDSPRAIRM